ncbi:MAG: IS30 family transposase [Actinobacteria bacterium]|nr:IS30 family transposase [Actinomycetota bacterium]
MKFTHLNEEQRYQIEARLASGKTAAQIAVALGVHRSTIYRELARGYVRGRYEAATAQVRAHRRRAKSAANHPTKAGSVWTTVRACLRQEWSPQQISGRLRLTETGPGAVAVSHQAIYDWLRREKVGLRSRLRHHCPQDPWRVSSGGLPAGRPSIRKRPPEVKAREQAGHWEGDTIRGRSAHHCLVTLVERKSLYTRLSRPLRKQATTVAKAVRHALGSLPALSLTLDNGSEFAAYTAMGLPVFFADPGRPRQRARNENTNGLIRQYIPKNARLAMISAQRIRRIEQRLNNRPRKTLGYRTPREVLFNLPPTPVAVRG